jgi:hypothetical protein
VSFIIEYEYDDVYFICELKGALLFLRSSYVRLRFGSES